MSDSKHDQHGRKAGQPHHGHPMSSEELRAKAELRGELVRVAKHKERHGHEHLHARPLHVMKGDGSVVPGTHPAPEYTDPKHVESFSRIQNATLPEVWAEFWAQAKAEGTKDPMGPAHDQLVRHYGFHGFYEERYAREQKRGGK